MQGRCAALIGLLCQFRVDALAKQKKREETSKFKILQIKKREYRDGIKIKETRPGWGEAHNVYKGIMEPVCAHRLHPILLHYSYSLCS